MNSSLLRPLLLPAVRFVEQEEARILKKGQPLTRSQQANARKAGVLHPERIRVLKVWSIRPRKSWIGWACKLVNAYPKDTAGCSYRYGILIRRDLADYRHNRELYLHEFAHVAQYERYGTLESFLFDYLSEVIYPGYGRGRLELEADRVAETLASQQG